MTLNKLEVKPLSKGSEYYSCIHVHKGLTVYEQLQFKNIKGDVNDVIYFSTRLTT